MPQGRSTQLLADAEHPIYFSIAYIIIFTPAHPLNMTSCFVTVGYYKVIKYNDVHRMSCTQNAEPL